MRLSPTAFFLLSFLGCSQAFLDTVPFVSWSSHDSATSRRISACHAGRMNASTPLHEVLQGDDVCEYDAVVFLEYPGLRASDLRSLSSSSSLSQALRAASHSAQLPYIKTPTTDFSAMSESPARTCAAPLVRTGPDAELPQLDGVKNVIHIRLPEVTGEGFWRRSIVAEHESIIARHISTIDSLTRKNLFVLMGSGQSEYAKRQVDTLLVESAPSNNTTGGILTHYQVLTPALIISLLIVFFVLVPIVLASINVLTSIQSSVRLDGPKVVGQDKKNQ